MDSQNTLTDLRSSDTLLKLVDSIKNPLSSIIAANDVATKRTRNHHSHKTAAEVTLQNSKMIADLIDEVVKHASTRHVQKQAPLIFELYETLPHVQAMCSDSIDPKKISKTDQTWLMNLEHVVFEEIKKSQINLFSLAFEVSVSERQLHRNIKKFLSLTPNKYIRILKLHKAKNLLEDYAYRTIAEVAYAVGFSDTYYFSKMFHNQYGIMPRELLPK
ncbi:helix-turn-helix domain-containing protein [Parapedobacter tibetensis]|uniref:helix-turn-helix domain-containing protein n=1 Tax=Parapedobacter tibetensis TaxID=2972951 RepID=UPI00214DE28D|nr:helix-turn-helix domain-containing protein [Parapedobacter tibetensis]